MSRNMIEANKYIFEVLGDFVAISKIDVPISYTNKRCIETTSEEKRWLQELNITKRQLILPNFQTASFEFDSKKYFVAFGLSNEEISEEVLQSVELNAGIVTALLSELKVPIRQKVDPYEIINDIFYETEENIIKYNFPVIANFFEPFSVYQIQENSPFITQDDITFMRLSGFYTLKTNELVALNFSSDTLDKFEKLFFEGSTNIPYENLLLSLVSVSWKYSFLDIYRCIERLFSISFLEDFHRSLQIPDSLLKFSSDVENYTGWKPKENEAVNKLIDASPEQARYLLQEIKRLVDGTEEGKCGDLIYKIRNSIVHFRPATQSVSLNDKNWDMLIRASLYIIEYWYNKYDE